jgi:rhomboid protease GluP
METRRMCSNCRAFIKTSDRVCPYCEVRVGPRAIDVREPRAILGGFIPHAHFTTSIILLLNFGLFAATVVSSMRAGHSDAFFGIDGQTLLDFGAKRRWEIFGLGEWWRLVAAGFLHGGIIHIAMNSWVMFDLGAQVEEIYGNARFMVIYFLATIGGFFVSTLWSSSLSIGASAGLCGLIGAMLALGVRNRTATGAAIRGMYTRWIVYLLVFGVVLPGIDNAAHIGGLAAGFAMGFVAGTPKLTNTWGERFWRAASYVCLALTAYSFLQMYLWLSHTAG